MVKNLPATCEIWVWSLGWEDVLEESMATHSSSLAWRIPLERGACWPTAHGVSESDTTEGLSAAQHILASDSPIASTLWHSALVQQSSHIWEALQDYLEFVAAHLVGICCHCYFCNFWGFYAVYPRQTPHTRPALLSLCCIVIWSPKARTLQIVTWGRGLWQVWVRWWFGHKLCPALRASGTRACRLLCPWGFSGKNTGVVAISSSSLLYLYIFYQNTSLTFSGSHSIPFFDSV